MYPVLFKIGSISIYSYGLMIAFGFLFATILSERYARKNGICPNLIMDLSVVVILSGLIGARILYVICNFQYFMSEPGEIVMLTRGGLIFYGGALFSIIPAYIFLKFKKVSFLKATDVIIPYATLAHSAGRIGCFLNGCCWGKTTVIFLGAKFSQSLYSLHPVQLYESIGLCGLSFLLIFIRKKKKFNGQVLLSWCIFYPILRFCLEFLRGDNEQVLIGLTFSQIISIFIVLIAIIILFLRKYAIQKKQNV